MLPDQSMAWRSHRWPETPNPAAATAAADPLDFWPAAGRGGGGGQWRRPTRLPRLPDGAGGEEGRGRRGGGGEDAVQEGREKQQRRVAPFYSAEQSWSKNRNFLRREVKLYSIRPN